MNWIRDNILKIVIGIFVIIIIAVIVVACSAGGGIKDYSSGYIEMENKLQNAAIKYVKEHPSILPKTTGNVKKVKLDTLINAGKIGKLYAPDNKNVVCKGHVEIEKISEDTKEYRYTPYVSCGKYYVTKTIADYIIDSETNNGEFTRTSGDGLYALNNDYIYKGEYPNNYIMIGNYMYRVVRVTADKELELISTIKTSDPYIWDDRYNITEDDYIGVNDFLKSRIYESLDFLSHNEKTEDGEVFFTEEERKYMIEHDFCIGKRDYDDEDIYSGAECAVKHPMKVGLLTVSEYAMGSVDPNCNNLYEKSCVNYNYLNMIDNKNVSSIITMTAVANNTYQYYKISGSIINVSVTKTNGSLYPVIYISDKIIYKSGSGRYDDPYIVR